MCDRTGTGLRRARALSRRARRFTTRSAQAATARSAKAIATCRLPAACAREIWQTGRASMLLQSDGLRTLGTKLNYATTLWDYIFRAMPWANPQSLSVDETYAVTAYVLHLNEIVPVEYELNEKTLLSVQMPNRNGLTTAHGLAKGARPTRRAGQLVHEGLRQRRHDRFRDAGVRTQSERQPRAAEAPARTDARHRYGALRRWQDSDRRRRYTGGSGRRIRRS